MTETALTREQKLAFSVLKQNAQYFDKLVISPQSLHKNGPLLKTNFMAFCHVPIEKTSLPVEDYWCWNQSNSKVQVQLDYFTTVTFRKLSTKKRSFSHEVAPSYKIWLFEIDSRIAESRYFLWCEKGICEPEYLPQQGVVTEIGIIFPEALCVESFSFLRPFVEENVANELGW